MIHIRTACFLFLCAGAPFALSAQAPITFDLNKVVDETDRHEDTVDGLNMIITTTDEWSIGDGIGLKVYDGLYVSSINGLEMTFRFNKAVRFDGYRVRDLYKLKGDESLTLSVGGVVQTTENSFVLGDNDFATSFTVAADTDIVLRSINPGGYTGECVTWSALTVTVIPEPATYALIIGGLALGAVILRRRFRR